MFTLTLPPSIPQRARRAAILILIASAVGAAASASAQQIAPVAANADWTPRIALFDDVPMALVPPGCFLMGREDAAPNELPVHEVCFSDPFWIDVHEVTHAQFAQFGAAAGRAAAFAEISADLPRERVTWFEARDLCALRGARLPSEAEWEYAARGPDSLAYPWGARFTPNTAVVALGPGGHPEAVGERADGASWVGAHDLIGNVWEWTNSLFAPYPFDAEDGRESPGRPEQPRVIRGGAWSFSGELARASVRAFRPPTTETPDIGFRCVRGA